MDINVMQFILEQYVWIIPVLICLGAVLKSVPFIPDWNIPLILYIVGMVLGYCFIDYTTAGAIQGLLAATAAIGTHQGFKQCTERC